MDLKTSKYVTVSTNSYTDRSAQEVKLLYSGRTGALLTVPATEAARVSRGDPPDDTSLLRALCEAEILVSEGEDEIAMLLERNMRAATNPNSLSFILVPSSYCNMGCSYCGQSHTRGPLPVTWEQLTIDRVEAALRRPTTKAVHIGWFGGEPLAGYPTILRVSAPLTATADELGIRYVSSITTNGSLLTVPKLIELRNLARIHSVEVTIDGPEKIHDNRRSLVSGSGNFRHVVSVLSAALCSTELQDVYIRIRTNVDNENAHYVADYLHEMKRLGFDHDRVTFDLHAVYSWSNDVSKVELTKERFAEEELDWMFIMLKLGLKFVALPTQPVDVVCVAAHPYAEVISSTGSIFSCTEHILVPQHEASDALTTLGAASPDPRPRGSFDDWNERVTRGEVPCHDCKVFGVCGGACPKHWSEGHIPCPSFKLNVQERLDMAAVLRGLRII